MEKSSFLGLFPGGSDRKESDCSETDPGSLLGLGRSPEEGNGNPLQYSCLENPMERGAWWTTTMGLQRVRHDWATCTFFTLNNDNTLKKLVAWFGSFPGSECVCYVLIALWRPAELWREITSLGDSRRKLGSPGTSSGIPGPFPFHSLLGPGPGDCSPRCAVCQCPGI